MSPAAEILTIGYGARSIEEFVAVLQSAMTDYLVDVRSVPYSRFKPEFSRKPLAAELEPRGIRYVFMGKELGGRPDEPACYDVDGRIDYSRLRLRPAFADGLTSLEAGWEAEHTLVLMCSEGKPQECHRAKLIAEELFALGVPAGHIDEHGVRRSHSDIMTRVTGGQEPLFGEHVAASRSRQHYRVAQRGGRSHSPLTSRPRRPYR
jgi:uncharacterized protein (DUF488 family)